MKLQDAILRLITVAAAGLALAECSKAQLQASLSADPALVAQAQQAYAQLASGDDAALIGTFAPDLQGQKPDRFLPAMRVMIPDGQSQTGKLVGWRKFAGTGGQQAQIVERYDYPGDHMISEVVFGRAKSGDAWKIIGFHLHAASSEEAAAPVFPSTQAAEPPPVARDKDAAVHREQKPKP